MNAKIRMTKPERMTKSKWTNRNCFCASLKPACPLEGRSFGIVPTQNSAALAADSGFWISSFLRHLSFGFGHSAERLIQHPGLVPAPCLPPPAKPAARIAQWLDFALFAAINHAHRDELDLVSGSDEFTEQF